MEQQRPPSSASAQRPSETQTTPLPQLMKRTRDTFLRQMLAESEPENNNLASVPRPYPKVSRGGQVTTTTTTTSSSSPCDSPGARVSSSSRGTASRNLPPLDRLKRAVLGEQAVAAPVSLVVASTPAPTTTSSSSMAVSPMTEIIVTVDSDGAIMGVDAAGEEAQTFIPVKGDRLSVRLSFDD